MAVIEYNNRHKSNCTDIWAHEEFIPQLIFLPCSLLRRRRRRKKGAWIPLMLLSPLSLFWDCSRTFPFTIGARNSSSSYCCGSWLMCGEGECPRPCLRRGGSICYSSLAGTKEVSATTSRVFHHPVVVVVVAPTAAWQAFMLPWWRSRNGRVRSSPPTNAEFDVHEGPARCGASPQGSNLEFICNSLRGDTRFQGFLQQLDLWGRKRRCKKQAPAHQVLNQKWIVKKKEEAEEDPWITFAKVSEALVPNPRRVLRVLAKWICEGEEEEEYARISGPSSFKSEMDCEGDLKME